IILLNLKFHKYQSSHNNPFLIDLLYLFHNELLIHTIEFLFLHNNNYNNKTYSQYNNANTNSNNSYNNSQTNSNYNYTKSNNNDKNSNKYTNRINKSTSNHNMNKNTNILLFHQWVHDHHEPSLLFDLFL